MASYIDKENVTAVTKNIYLGMEFAKQKRNIHLLMAGGIQVITVEAPLSKQEEKRK